MIAAAELVVDEHTVVGDSMVVGKAAGKVVGKPAGMVAGRVAGTAVDRAVDKVADSSQLDWQDRGPVVVACMPEWVVVPHNPEEEPVMVGTVGVASGAAA